MDCVNIVPILSFCKSGIPEKETCGNINCSFVICKSVNSAFDESEIFSGDTSSGWIDLPVTAVCSQPIFLLLVFSL